MSAKGTFTATGVSDTVIGNNIDILLDFGTGSVDLEVQMPSGNWIKIETAITADYHKVFEPASEKSVRLNCTAYTSAIEWALMEGD